MMLGHAPRLVHRPMLSDVSPPAWSETDAREWILRYVQHAHGRAPTPAAILSSIWWVPARAVYVARCVGFDDVNEAVAAWNAIPKAVPGLVDVAVWRGVPAFDVWRVYFSWPLGGWPVAVRW